MAEPVYHRVETHRVFEDGTEELAGVQFVLPSGQAVCERDGLLEVDLGRGGKFRLAPGLLDKIAADPRAQPQPSGR